MSLSRRSFIKLAGLGTVGTLLCPPVALAAGGVDAANGVAMLYDATKCIGCKACQNACKDWNRNPPELDPSGLYDAPLELSADTWTLIQLYEGNGERSFVKLQCMHCLYPACVSACPVKALQKSPDGPVTYDPKRCIGCRYCMVACPFRVPRFKWDAVLSVVTKCTFCKDRLVKKLGPACVEACPAGALAWGKRGALLAEAHQRLSENPGQYVNYVYGEHDGGGTSVLYLSSVPFEKLGLPDLGHEPVPALNDFLAPIILPTIFIGGVLTLISARFLSGRRGSAAVGHKKEH
ncbi:MAG: hydrogenase 2 operon protein HybA [Anaerolineae bacterium]|nr:hydrogenase 2 operon protein HybA [Anaerolineae bacterium]